MDLTESGLEADRPLFDRRMLVLAECDSGSEEYEQ
jgi:hypothetical protein